MALSHAQLQTAAYLALQVYQQPADWLVYTEGFTQWIAIEELRAARRLKPPSLKEQALLVLDDANLDAAHHNILLRALEQLDD
jgi:phage baseplate assembly protein gpV